MTITFDPNPTFDELMAAFDKAEQKCSPQRRQQRLGPANR